MNDKSVDVTGSSVSECECESESQGGGSEGRQFRFTGLILD